MADFWLGASALFSDPTALMIFAGGLLGGMLFGAIPGINMLTLGAVILPFTAAMNPTHAIMLYSVIYCAGVFGGAITAILFNIPGSPENAPTAFDGYPMTQNGEAAKAIGAAVICSAFGGICSAVLMMTATPTIAGWAVRAFGPPEIFALICFGLAVSASVGAADLWKGLLSVSLGLLIATIGTDPADGIARYNFGTYYLLAGIHFIPVVLGLFAVAEVFTQGAKSLTENPGAARVQLSLPSFFEFWRLKFTVLRSMVIGFFAGILPGIGAVLAAFLSYNEAVRWSPKGKFGKGELGGVVASETANNSATGAAMIPLLALGLPGGALTAMMMGVFQIHGMEPGPLVFITSKELVWVVFAAMFFANIAILGLGYIQTKTVVHLLRIPFHLLAPAILLIATIGAYALRNLTVDIWVMYIAGIVGFLLRRSGYSVAGIVMGLILGSLGESSFTKSMQLLNYDPLALFGRPIAALLLTAAILTLMWNIAAAVRQLRPDVPSESEKEEAR
ncbi:MAG: tripartite tricarboxylate transporter permease [Pseudomonadota bacterium]